MKKEKGFTLIELLAVIIILGILMMVAIPSVTTYINSSRKSAYIDNIKQYISASVTAVNSGEKIEFYDENTLLLIPVGHDETKSLIKLEKGGQSPYSSTYYFAYVGVTYDNSAESYTYLFTSVDGSGQGLKMASQKQVEAKDGDKLIKAGLKSTSNLSYTSAVHDLYNNNAQVKYRVASNLEGDGFTGFQNGTITGLADLLEAAGGAWDATNNADGIKYLLVCNNEGCPVVDAAE